MLDPLFRLPCDQYGLLIASRALSCSFRHFSGSPLFSLVLSCSCLLFLQLLVTITSSLYSVFHWFLGLSLFVKFVSDIIHLEILSFVYQWYHKLSPSSFVNFFNRVSSIHSYNTRQSQIDNLFVASVHTTEYGIRSLSYTGPKLWNSLSIDLKKIKPFSSFRQYIKNSVINGYNTIIDS